MPILFYKITLNDERLMIFSNTVHTLNVGTYIGMNVNEINNNDK